ncbi:hypothetical protein E2C01_014014 [Portunus trituberculatus]|uniref:Uncharacterized protein n=1 Tax=Portunus trituberculatus TaxID=210409 RepID=A0A5B7DHQ0_PORTR|nr:hypothetical protein [Portunus trituberculatus]
MRRTDMLRQVYSRNRVEEMPVDESVRRDLGRTRWREVFACGRTEKARAIVAITCRAFGRALAFLPFDYVDSYGSLFLVCYCKSLAQCRCAVVVVVASAAAGMV